MHLTIRWVLLNSVKSLIALQRNCYKVSLAHTRRNMDQKEQQHELRRGELATEQWLGQFTY